MRPPINLFIYLSISLSIYLANSFINPSTPMGDLELQVNLHVFFFLPVEENQMEQMF